MPVNPQKYPIRKLDPGDYALWDQFVYNSQGGTLFQTSRWAILVQKVCARNFEIYAAFKGPVIVSGIICWPKKILNKHALTQAPVTPYQGIIIRKSESEKPSAIIAEQHEFVNPLIRYLNSKFSLIDIPLSRDIQDMRPYLWNNFEAQPMYSYAFPLSEKDKLYNQFSQSLRRKIKNREKVSLTVEESDDPRLLHQYVLDSYNKHRMKPPLDAESLRCLFSEVKEQQLGRLFYLFREKQPVAGLLVLHDEKNVYAYFAGLDEQSRSRINTEYLYYHVMVHRDFQGKYFDFLGADLPWFEQFKRSFGGQLQAYYRVRYYSSPILKLFSDIRRQQQTRRRRKGNAR